MTFNEFLASLEASSPDCVPDQVLKALWWDKKGDWDFAHSIAQSTPTVLGSAVHAYLHRREGEEWNARYWYSHAGRPLFAGSLDEEWRALVEEALEFYRQDIP
ncbi:hypothetical protein [Marispirochaeta aestuarii]|uniref:hypothetical protein n=1 Tax=Marispirochaeta aestuarii TaxID=1963862 RepID=UPI0029C8580B|nr:hypothetical protein [Marispirochaeta aestuarii]